MRKLAIGLFAVAAINIQPIKAQTADEVVDKYITATGAKEKLLSPERNYIYGSIETNIPVDEKVFTVK